MKERFALLRLIAFLAETCKKQGLDEPAMYLRIAHCALWDALKRERT